MAWSLNQLSVSQAIYMKGNIQVDSLPYSPPEGSGNSVGHSVSVKAPSSANLNYYYHAAVAKIRLLVANSVIGH
jgi:hypothetical protein